MCKVVCPVVHCKAVICQLYSDDCRCFLDRLSSLCTAFQSLQHMYSNGAHHLTLSSCMKCVSKAHGTCSCSNGSMPAAVTCFTKATACMHHNTLPEVSCMTLALRYCLLVTVCVDDAMQLGQHTVKIRMRSAFVIWSPEINTQVIIQELYMMMHFYGIHTSCCLGCPSIFI